MASQYRVARRIGAMLVAAAAALLVAAPPAVAATSGKYVGTAEPGMSVSLDGRDGDVRTLLLGLRLDDGTELKTYCVELHVSAREGARMSEAPWERYPGTSAPFEVQPDKVLWILHNSYPNVSLNELGEKVGSRLSTRQAIAGTQAAIWHFSDEANLDADNPAAVRALYTYLTGDANTGLTEQPPVSLAVTPESIGEVPAGEAAGPYTVSSTADSVTLTVSGPEGVAVVDADGNPLDQAANGTKFWLSAPADGEAASATVTATAAATVEKGRLFVGDDSKPTQTLIVAASTPAKAKVSAAAEWLTTPPSTPTTTTPTETSTPAPTTTTTTTDVPAPPGPPEEELPNTGASGILPILGIGLALLAAGVGALFLQRRLRRNSAPSTE